MRGTKTVNEQTVLASLKKQGFDVDDLRVSANGGKVWLYRNPTLLHNRALIGEFILDYSRWRRRYLLFDARPDRWGKLVQMRPADLARPQQRGA